MFDSALKVLKIIESKGFRAYIVGGYPRDLYLGKKTLDIDISTNATPKDLKEIFIDSRMSNDKYGSVSLYYRKTRYEITTFRQDIGYINNRKPLNVKYINDLKEDLKRRDFTINTLCIDSDGNLLDLLDIKRDLDNKIIKTVGNPKTKLKEDSLRILRAVRFATVLDFDLDHQLKKYIKKYAYLVKKLSYYRKKEELDKIFVSFNRKKGIQLLTELELLTPLEITNVNNIVLTDSIIGIWAQLNPVNYQFCSHEKDMIKNINELLIKDILDNNVLYRYNLYELEIAASIKGIDRKKVVKKHSQLLIHNQQDIILNPIEISKLLNKEPGSYLKDILKDLEYKLINNELVNDKEIIKRYLISKYKTT
jgi:tRNA nucleotidyltransferase (CCA-adding enzyme)